MRLLALLMALLGFVPFANWITGGHQYELYRHVASEWLNGSLIVVGSAAVLAILSRRVALWRPGLFDGVVGAAHDHPRRTGAILFAGSLAVYLFVARWVLAGRPLLIDEIDAVFHARIFLQGKLWLEPPRYPEFTSALHVIDFGGKYLTHFPPGGPLVLAAGVAGGAPWVVHPLLGATSALVFWGLSRRIEPRPGVALAATLLFAFSPFVAFLSGSFMNHVPVLTALIVAMYALARQTGDDRVRPGWAALAGFMLGVPAAIRPMDAIAFAVPAGVWMVWRTFRQPSRLPELVAAGLALSVPVGGVLWYNAQVTGHPLTFPMEMLWGKIHGIGFHASPWGPPHTPARGLELVNLYFLRLQSALFELPIPSLTVPIVALLAIRRAERFDRYLLATFATVVVLYFAYWGDGIYLGPRYLLVLVPALSLWSARLPSALRARLPGREVLHRAVGFALVVSAAIALFMSIPYRALEYRTGYLPMRIDYDSLAQARGVRNAIVLVREAWGSQLIARMWALGVSRTDTESIYRAVDACVLDGALERLERGGIRGAEAYRQLQVLTVDSARLEMGVLTPDRTLRSLPGRPYVPRCVRRVLEDRAGFTLGTATLAQPRGSNVFVRDLHARDTVLLREYPGRPLYLLRPESSEAGAPLRLERLSLDSLSAEWQVTPSSSSAGAEQGARR
ncbi:MAG TPA: glycosyltransferase family 39 protein [Gemmatimonadaceae bacterium]|nr:glycosyltransferase family 39 protein [Gemmatimonadaceae bacterium]